jgi:hypothetical protein
LSASGSGVEISVRIRMGDGSVIGFCGRVAMRGVSAVGSHVEEIFGVCGVKRIGFNAVAVGAFRAVTGQEWWKGVQRIRVSARVRSS